MLRTAKLLGAVLAIFALVCVPTTSAFGTACCGGPTVTAPSSVMSGGCFDVSAASSDYYVELVVTDALGNVLYDSAASGSSGSVIDATICLDPSTVGPITVEATDGSGAVTTTSISVL